MNDIYLVSIIVNCHNSETYLNECLKSLINQTYSNIEIIIIDNKSIDNTKQIVKNFRDKRIRYYYSKKFLSLGAARNFGISKMCGKFLAFLDSDDFWEKKKISKSIPFLKNNYGLVYSNVNYFSERERFLLYSRRNPYKEYCFTDLAIDYSLCLSSCLFSKKLIDDYKIRFNPKLEVCEDYDFFLKITYRTKVYYLEETLVNYRIHPLNLTNTKRELFFKETRQVIDSFEDLSINIKRKILNKNDLEESKYEWEKKNIRQALLKLWGIKKTPILNKVFYSFIFLFPYDLIYKTYNMIRGSRNYQDESWN